MSAVTLSMIEKEFKRQNRHIELVASENYVSDDVAAALGSCLTNTYAEGYPALRPEGRCGRYGGGCEFVDEIENFCCELWKNAFKTNYYVNVQPHSGSNANIAAYKATVEPGETILALTCSAFPNDTVPPLNSNVFRVEYYGLDEKGFIDYDAMEAKAQELRPRLIVAGSSLYSRIIDYERIADIAASVFSYFMVDMSNIAGLVIAGEHPSPMGVADIITTATNGTLRGPRGGMIFCKPGWATKVDNAVFPATQDAPLMNAIAAKAVAGEEVLRSSYRKYIRETVHNSKSMAKEFKRLGYDVVTGGTDTHMFILDLSKINMSGKLVQETLDEHNISVNKSMIPRDPRKPLWTSGIRIGTMAMTTRGYQALEFMNLADEIDEIITQKLVTR